MTRVFTIQAIWVLALLSGGSIGLAATSDQDGEPAIVAPEFDTDIDAGAAGRYLTCLQGQDTQRCQYRPADDSRTELLAG
jgi:hypothetical protein